MNTNHTLLSRLSQAIASTQDTTELLRTIVAELQPVFGFYDVGLFVVNQAEDYHVDLATEMPEISPSEANLANHLRSEKTPHENSLIAWMMNEIEVAGQPVLFDFVDLVDRFPDYPQWEAVQQTGHRDCLATTLQVRGETIGMFCLNSLEKDHFRTEQFALFQAVADQVAITLSHIQAKEEVLAQKQRVEQLLTISQAIIEISDRQQLLKTIYEHIKPIFPYDAYGLFVLTEDKQYHYELIDAEVMDNKPLQVAIEQQYGAHYRYRHVDTNVAHFMQEGPGLFRLVDHTNHPQMKIAFQQGYQQFIAGPLVYGGEQIGMLCFISQKEDFYTEQDLPLFEAIAEQMSVAIANVLANERVLQEKQFKETLLSISEAVASIQDRKELFRVIFERVRPLVKFDDFGLFNLSEDGKYHRDLAVTDALGAAHNSLLKDQQLDDYLPHDGSVDIFIREGPLAVALSELMRRFPGHPFYPAMQQSGLKQILGGPLIYHGRKIGMLAFNSTQADFYSEKDYVLFQAIADQLAVAVSNVLSNEALQQRAEEKALKLALIKALEGSAPLPDKLPALASLLHAALPYHLLCLWVETPVHSLGYHLLPTGPKDFQRLDKAQYLPLLQLTEEAYRRGYSSHLSKAFLWTAGQPSAPHPLLAKIMRRWQMQSALVLPLSLSDEQSAYLTLAARPEDYYTEQQLGQLSKLGDTLSLALDRQLAQQHIAQLNEQLQQENEYLLEEVSRKYSFGEMIGQSDSLQRVFAQIEQVAYTDATVLVQGETGTGKELIARAIHQASPRSRHLLVRINCAAIPEALFESELFGHERGAFTGATQQKIGKFELAHRGTIFLDEIGELPLSLQAKLLRVLQEGEFERVGGNRTIKSGFRLVAATNRDLLQSVGEGRFRADLYYRLSTFPVSLLPLRERKEDILLLAEHFARQYSRHIGQPYRGFTQAALRSMQHYEFPGNIRELRNLVERAVIVAEGKPIHQVLSGPADPAARVEVTSNGLPPLEQITQVYISEQKDALERRALLKVLEATRWRVRGKQGAATVLGLKPTTLEARMKKLGLER